MALIKCPECGKDISDKAASCPQCGYLMIPSSTEDTILQEKVKKNNKKKFMILAVLSIVVVAVVIISSVIKFGGNNKDYPNLIGKIHLDMAQDEVEKILKKEITEDLDISASYITDGNSISIYTEKALDQMSFIRKHPSAGMIDFEFDDKGKLQIIEIIVDGSMQSAVEEYGLGAEYEKMRREGKYGKRRYTILGKTRIEVERAMNDTATRIGYVRVEDTDE